MFKYLVDGDTVKNFLKNNMCKIFRRRRRVFARRMFLVSIFILSNILGIFIPMNILNFSAYAHVLPRAADYILDEDDEYFGYYKLEDAGNLLWFSQQINRGKIKNDSNAVLMADGVIDMKGVGNWIPIGVYDDKSELAVPYTGTFDGNGVEIVNLRCDSSYQQEKGLGFIGFLGPGGSVKGLTLKNVYISGSKFIGAIAGIAGLEDGASDQGIEIMDCHVINEGGQDFGVMGIEEIGGLLGCGRGVHVYESSNSENVRGKSFTGGLMGKGYDVEIKGFKNEGKILGRGSNVGGVAGAVDGLRLNTCTNSGDVIGNNISVGGLIGVGCGYINMCEAHNNADVKGEGMYVGGLIGYKCGCGKVVIISGINMGDIRGGMSNVGGLVGLGNDLIVIKSKNRGNIYSLYSVGGLIGGGERSVIISQSCNLGKVNGGQNNIGGLVGYVNGEAMVKLSVNDGGLEGNGDVGDFMGRVIGDIIIYFCEDEKGDLSSEKAWVGVCLGKMRLLNKKEILDEEILKGLDIEIEIEEEAEVE